MTIRCLSGLYVGFLFCQASMKKREAGCMPVRLCLIMEFKLGKKEMKAVTCRPVRKW